MTALVPMRHASERVPGKNYRLLAGKPLYHWIVEALLACPRVDGVAIDTDSDVVRADAAARFPSVVVLERPPHLRGGAVAMNEVLRATVERLPGEAFLQTHATNPLLSAKTIERAVERYFAGLPEHDSLFGVTRRQVRLWDADGRPINHDPGVLLRTQDLPPVYEENSCIYVFSRDVLERRRNRIGERPRLFEVDPAEALDIDEELDFAVAEFLVRRRQGEGG